MVCGAGFKPVDDENRNGPIQPLQRQFYKELYITDTSDNLESVSYTHLTLPTILLV